MQARMNHPVMIVPDAMPTLQTLGKVVMKAAKQSDLPLRTLHLVYLRASQINGCSVCVDMHVKDAKRDGESDERLFAVGAWREAPYFTDAERAALALAESETRLSDRSDPVSDSVWEDVTRHYAEPARAVLVLAIGMINLWNRVNAATKQVAGAWAKSQ